MFSNNREALGVSKDSETPKTDEKIVSCFKQSRNLVRSWTVVFLVVSLAAVLTYFFLTKNGTTPSLESLTNEDRWFLALMWGLFSGSSIVSGTIYNLISLMGLRSTQTCLNGCGDVKTHSFLKEVKKLQKYTLLDTLLILCFPLKFVTTVMIKIQSYRLRSMLKKVEKKVSKKK